MSASVSSFSKLSISQEMQAARGHGLSGKGKQPVPVEDDSDSGSEAGSDDLLSGHDSGNGHVFALDHCRQLVNSETEQSYYAFQIASAEVERYGIRIYPSDFKHPECSCDDEEEICLHMTWLMEQLGYTSEDIEEGESDVHQHISDQGLGNLCEDLEWELREGAATPSHNRWDLKKDYQTSNLSRQTRAMIRERVRSVRDIMATLSPEVTEAYRPDIFDSPDDITRSNVLVEGDLEATVARLLILDDIFFKRFQALVPRDLRATEYFHKMGLKAVEAFRLLDEYEEIGPKSGQHDLAWCAQTLVKIVEAISTNVTKRQPLSPSSREEAAKSLVSILFDVVKFQNYDHYQNVKWPRRRANDEPSIDRNLYERLIKSTSRVNPSGGTFVLKALQDLPEAQRFVDKLETVHEMISTIGWGPAPQAYRDKLAALITQLKGVPGPSASSGKRHASAMDRKVKRMK